MAPSQTQTKTAARPDLSGKTALITGASRGIGAATAMAMAACGAHVILAARTVGGLEEMDDKIRGAGGTATIMPLDLMQLEDLDKVGPSIFERFGTLDIFVANAGILGTLGPVAHGTPREWEKVFRVNVLANQRLIRSLDPVMRTAQNGHAIFMTSEVGHAVCANWSAYAASKAALEMMVNMYRDELPQTSTLSVHLFDPGATRTNMRAEAYPGENPDSLKTADDTAANILDLFT